MDSFCQPLAVPQLRNAQRSGTMQPNFQAQRHPAARPAPTLQCAHAHAFCSLEACIHRKKMSRGDSNHNVTESPSGTSLELPQNLIVSEGTTPPNFQEFSLQSLQFPDKFRKNIESSVILIFSYLCTEARRTI